MQDLLEYTQELRLQFQMLTTGNLSHRLGNIRQIVYALENEILDQTETPRTIRAERKTTQRIK